jgi:hypothetical protein
LISVVFVYIFWAGFENNHVYKEQQFTVLKFNLVCNDVVLTNENGRESIFFFSCFIPPKYKQKKNTQLGISYLHNLECYYFLFGFSDKIKIDVIIFNESD